jgi:hypothetical protein
MTLSKNKPWYQLGCYPNLQLVSMNPKEGFKLGPWGKVTILIWNYRMTVYAYGN